MKPELTRVQRGIAKDAGDLHPDGAGRLAIVMGAIGEPLYRGEAIRGWRLRIPAAPQLGFPLGIAFAFASSFFM